jgi:diacylglycerol kinase (ATP)
VVNGLMEAHASGFILPTFSVIPIGRGNDFAYGIGLRGS